MTQSSFPYASGAVLGSGHSTISSDCPQIGHDPAVQSNGFPDTTLPTLPSTFTQLLPGHYACTEPKLGHFGGQRGPMDWWMGERQRSLVEANRDEPLDLSLKCSTLQPGATLNGFKLPNLATSILESSFDTVKLGWSSLKTSITSCSGLSEADYMHVWRNLYYQSFRNTIREGHLSGLSTQPLGFSIQPPPPPLQQQHQYYNNSPSIASRSNQSRTHVKSLPSELSPSCSYRLGRIRRLTNYWSETMNKSNPCPRPGMDVARPTENRQPKDTKLSRRPYTEAELAAAVRAICFDRLGTRRAASVYGIPRSTLRNKICKLNELKKREEERLGGKSIVMADFLHSLIRSQKVETPETTRFPWSGHTDSINSTRPTVRETTDDPGRLFTTATHVASIFQVNCRKNYGTRNSNEMPFNLRSTNPCRSRGGRFGRLCTDRRQMDLRRVTKIIEEKSQTMEDKCNIRSQVTNVGSPHETYPTKPGVPNPKLSCSTGFTTSVSSAFDPVLTVTKV